MDLCSPQFTINSHVLRPLKYKKGMRKICFLLILTCGSYDFLCHLQLTLYTFSSLFFPALAHFLSSLLITNPKIPDYPSSFGAAVEIEATMIEVITIGVLMMTSCGIVPKKMKYFHSVPWERVMM
jgi:hypothetical protein